MYKKIQFNYLIFRKIVNQIELVDPLINLYTFREINTTVPAISIKDHLETIKELLQE